MRERSLNVTLTHCHNNTAVASRSRRVGVYRISILDRSIDNNMVVGVMRLIIRSKWTEKVPGNRKSGSREISRNRKFRYNRGNLVRACDRACERVRKCRTFIVVQTFPPMCPEKMAHNGCVRTHTGRFIEKKIEFTRQHWNSRWIEKYIRI
jgi:hypothetical protein